MGLFNRTKGCPVCKGTMSAKDAKLHLMDHVKPLPPSAGRSGYTYTCFCGPGSKGWDEDWQAYMGLKAHLMTNHHLMEVMDDF